MSAIASLPLRRRCLFLVDRHFIADEYVRLCHSPARRDAIQRELRCAVDEVAAELVQQRRLLIDEQSIALLPSVEEAVQHLQGCLPRLGVESLTVEAFFVAWEDAVELWLFFLDEIAIIESRPSTSASLSPALRRTADAVRHALCQFISAFYSDGKLYFESKKDPMDAKVAPAVDTSAVDHAVNTCSWSIGAPVASDVYGYFTSATVN